MVMTSGLPRRGAQLAELQLTGPEAAAYRVHRGLTQQQIADRMGASQATVSRLEANAGNLPARTIASLAGAYKRTPAEFVREAVQTWIELIAKAGKGRRNGKR